MLGDYGTGRYLREVLARLVDEADLEFVLAGDTARLARFVEGTGVPRRRVRLAAYDAPIYSVREQVVGATALNRLGADVLFFPHFNVPVTLRRRMVVIVHDTTHVRLAPAYGRIRARLARAVMGRAVRTARRVITSSATTARDQARLFPGEEAKTVIAPGAAGGAFRPATGDELGRFRRRVGLSGPYVVSVGNRKPHKNLRAAAAAIARARERHPELSWVVIGNRFGARDEVDAASDALGTALRQVEGVTDEELRLYYAGAQALLMPSRWEGFGLPVLEAMACGTPVITSSAEALAEVGGEAAARCGADDAPGFAREVVRLVEDGEYRLRRSREGRERAARFSWERSAGLVAQALRAAGGE